MSVSPEEYSASHSNSSVLHTDPLDTVASPTKGWFSAAKQGDLEKLKRNQVDGEIDGMFRNTVTALHLAAGGGHGGYGRLCTLLLKEAI